jgi:hypothetical protein
MIPNHNNMEELREVAPLVAEIGKEMKYTVPDNYFDSLSETIIAHIRLEKIKSAGESSPYSVPESYFENLLTSILYKIKSETLRVQEELLEIAPVLSAIKKENPYSLPSGYFENLSVNIKGSVKPLANVVSLKTNIRKWVTYTAAASVLLFVAFASYLFISIHGKNTEKFLSVEQRIAQLNEQEIINYLKDNADGFTSADLVPANDSQDPEIQNLLQNVSDQDIQNYLDDYDETPTEKPVKGI